MTRGHGPSFCPRAGPPQTGEALACNVPNDVPQQMPACLTDERPTNTSRGRAGVTNTSRAPPARRRDVAALVVRLAGNDVDLRLAQAIAGSNPTSTASPSRPRTPAGDAADPRNRRPLQRARPSTPKTTSAAGWPTCAGCTAISRATRPRGGGLQRRRRRGAALRRVPPYFETRAYVGRVLTMAGMGHMVPSAARSERRGRCMASAFGSWSRGSSHRPRLGRHRCACPLPAETALRLLAPDRDGIRCSSSRHIPAYLRCIPAGRMRAGHRAERDIAHAPARSAEPSLHVVED